LSHKDSTEGPTKHVKGKLEALRKRHECGDDSEIIVWINKDLGCAQRPLRHHPKYGGRTPLPPDARPLVAEWVKRVREHGFKSIICLLEDAQLDRYYVRGGLGLHANGLLGYYKSQGFEVRHFALTDYQSPSVSEKETIIKLFDELPKPVLLHCSAGIDRTSPVAGYIFFHKSNVHHVS
jgi:hypothetical protein